MKLHAVSTSIENVEAEFSKGFCGDSLKAKKAVAILSWWRSIGVIASFFRFSCSSPTADVAMPAEFRGAAGRDIFFGTENSGFAMAEPPVSTSSAVS